MIQTKDNIFKSQDYIFMTYAEHPGGVPFHEHEFIELAYVLEGHVEHTLDAIPMTISAGDYFIVDYGVRHKYRRIDDSRFRLINCLFFPQLIDETLHNCRRFENIMENYQINLSLRALEGAPTRFIYHDTDGKILKILKRMLNEFDSKPYGYQEMLRCQLIELLLYTMRKIQLPNSEDYDNDMIQYVINYVKKHYPEKLSLEAITKKFDYSLSYISRIFKSEIGYTFQEYVQSVRIQESCRLLINTQKKVTDIATSVGYSDIKFFNNIFKRQMGMSPREYRNANKEQGNGQ